MSERADSSERADTTATDGADDRSTPERRDAIPRARIADETGRAGTASDTDDDPEPAFLRAPIEPEAPSAENALFVVIGVVGTVLLFVSAVAPGLL